MAKSEIESMLNSRLRTTCAQLESSSSTQLSQASSLRVGRPPLPPNDAHRGERRASHPSSSSSTQHSPMPSPLLPPSPPAPLHLNLSQQSEMPTSFQPSSSSSQSLEVVAHYASESSRSIFLRCQELNWIRVSGRPLYWNAESKILICDLADRAKRLVDRSLLYMKV